MFVFFFKKQQVLQSYLDGKEEEEHDVFLMVQEAQKGIILFIVNEEKEIDICHIFS